MPILLLPRCCAGNTWSPRASEAVAPEQVTIVLQGKARKTQPIDSDHHCHAPLSYVALNKSGKIVGHLGLCRTYFRGQGITGPSGRVATMHIIDWLGSPEQRSIGISLMRLSHQGVETQFGLGVSPSALAVGERAGYQLRGLVPVYNRVLRAWVLAP